MENKTAEEIMTSKKLFARLLAKYVGTDKEPDIVIDMIGKDEQVAALYNTCLEFSKICNELAESKVKQLEKNIQESDEKNQQINHERRSAILRLSNLVDEKDKEIEMFAIGLHEWLHKEGYGWGNKPHQMYRGGKYFLTKDLIELYKQSLNK